MEAAPAAEAPPRCFEAHLSLPRTWCARFVTNRRGNHPSAPATPTRGPDDRPCACREEAALLAALARAGIALDALAHRHVEERQRALRLQRVASALQRRLAGGARSDVCSINSCIPVVAQAQREGRLATQALGRRLAAVVAQVRLARPLPRESRCQQPTRSLAVWRSSGHCCPSSASGPR